MGNKWCFSFIFLAHCLCVSVSLFYSLNVSLFFSLSISMYVRIWWVRINQRCLRDMREASLILDYGVLNYGKRMVFFWYNGITVNRFIGYWDLFLEISMTCLELIPKCVLFNGIIRLMGSVCLGPKVFLLSGAHYISISILFQQFNITLVGPNQTEQSFSPPTFMILSTDLWDPVSKVRLG
jgi:hypothetical protein